MRLRYLIYLTGLPETTITIINAWAFLLYSQSSGCYINAASYAELVWCCCGCVEVVPERRCNGAGAFYVFLEFLTFLFVFGGGDVTVPMLMVL